MNGAGAVVEHEGLFHMLYNDIQGGWPPNQIAIGYATSPDGIEWERATSASVLSAEALPYPGEHIFASGVLVEDGVWTLYFHVVADEQASGQGDSIGMATAPEPTGPWTVHPMLLLEPDPGGWDSYALWAPNVVKTDTGYHMYYTGIGDPPLPEIAIGLATSEDGVSWTRRAKPVLTKGPEGSWDHRKVEQGQLVRIADVWYMIYRTDTASGTFGPEGSALGLAKSSDGVNWVRVQEDPVLVAGNGEPWLTLWSVGAFSVDDRIRIVVEAAGPFPGTRWFPFEMNPTRSRG